MLHGVCAFCIGRCSLENAQRTRKHATSLLSYVNYEYRHNGNIYRKKTTTTTNGQHRQPNVM